MKYKIEKIDIGDDKIVDLLCINRTEIRTKRELVILKPVE